MPLSEEELRLLEQMERALVEDDPKLASTLRGTAFRRSARRKAVVAGVCFAAGVVVLMVGAVYSQPVVGVVGFLVMLASATVALSAARGHHGPAASDPRISPHPSHGFTVVDGGRRTKRPRRSGNAGSKQSFMDRMEERWRRRREENGGF